MKPKLAAGRSAPGFTLVELVISSGVMVLILTSAYLCLSGAVSSRKLIESRNDAAQSARVALALISADLRMACVLSKEFEFIGMDRALGEVEADNLDFATRNYPARRPMTEDWCEVSYYLAEEANGELTLWRRRDPTPDDEPLAGGSREEIARQVRGLKLEYYDGFDWYDDWGDPDGRRKAETSQRDTFNLYGLPEAVRIRLSFDLEARPATGSAKENENREPPLVFETIVRLNLASLNQGSSSAGGSTNAAAAPTGAGGLPAGEEVRP